MSEGKILIRGGVILLPIKVDDLDFLLEHSREALGWKLEDFLKRAKTQEQS